MLTIPSHHKAVNLSSSQTLNAKEIEFDCVNIVSPNIHFSLDTVDNPLLRQIFEQDVTERNILQQMKSEYNRSYSFQNKWPLHYISPKSLVEAGFFYLQEEDKVQCPFCEIIIYNWTQGDKPLREHMKKSPKCPFLMGQDVGHINLSEKHHNTVDPRMNNACSSKSVSVSYKPKHPRMADVKRRLLTYSGWPLNEPGPEQLAECGLYYSGMADAVTCFFCGGTLANWEPDDNPWKEHARYFPECSFLELAKSKREHSLQVNTSRKSLNEQKSLIHLPAADATSEIVQQALDIFPKDLVLEAVKKRYESPFSLQEICDDVLELKQKSDLQKTAPTTQLELKTDTHSASGVDLLLCKVCMDRERGVVFQPCGHFVTCWNCASMIADCPVCRRHITHKIRTYIS